jgi:hypothetical protein
MLFISYQGIFDGQNYQDANTPTQISKAFNAGFSCMVDVWRVDGVLYLGTDEPITQVTEKYLQGPRFWINARNIEMQEWIITQPTKLYPNYFWFPTPQENTPTETSSGKLITPGTIAINNTSIVFLPEVNDQSLFSTVQLKCYGICSNMVRLIKRMRNEGVWY